MNIVDADKRGPELDRAGTVIFAEVLNTSNLTVLTENANKTKERANVIKVCSIKMFNIRILLKGQMKVGLNENGSRLSLVSCEIYKKRRQR